MNDMIQVSSSGSFVNTENFLRRMSRDEIFSVLDEYGRKGAEALSNATPRKTGRTADSWTYEVIRKRGMHEIVWHNTNVTKDGAPVAILLQYGHGTGTGGYVEGRDYINPVIQPIFDEIADKVWKAVKFA